MKYFLEHFGAGEFWWLLFGTAAQAVFFLRMVAQWLASERSRKSVVPQAFWYLSLTGGAALLVYAVHRREPVFAIGQAIGLSIYLRNLMLIDGKRGRLATVMTAAIVPVLSVAAYGFASAGAPAAQGHPVHNIWWFAFGLAAQSCFFLRFFVQWIVSERHKRSVVPPAFWYLSLAGGVMLSAYAARQAEPVFLAGQLAGVFIYLRNIMFVRGERARTSGS